MKMRALFLRLAVFLVIVGAVNVCPSPADANITITPTRVIFEGRDRFADVFLVNTSDKPQTYEMSWMFFRMQEQGTPYVEIEAPLTDFDLSKHVVFTPRRVTLAPGAKQRVRLALRRPAEEIPPGDYHAHLKFGGVPVAPPAEGTKEEEKKKNSASAAVGINVGYSIPVIFRVGEPSEKAVIESLDLKFNEKNGLLRAVIPTKRLEGPYGIIGHLYIYHQEPGGKEDLVGEIGNAHIFPEITRRVFEFPLQKKGIKDGSIRVVLKHFDKEKNIVYDEKIFPLQ